ncbi:MAG: hypothetical protein LBS97_07125 [Treponema sp.]|jgi:hypothetical protein|nr:hypothetical protein [Treponema sp.]
MNGKQCNTKTKICFFSGLFLSFFPAFVFSYIIPPEPSFLHESAGIRARFLETWFTQPFETLRSIPAEVSNNEYGKEFQIRLEEEGSLFHIAVIPQTQVENDIYADDNIETRVSDAFTIDTSGSWVLTREKETGKATAITWYFSGNSGVYVRFYPAAGHTTADFMVFNIPVVRTMPVAVRFERLYTASFEEVKNWTPILPWSYGEPDRSLNTGNLYMIDRIRENLPRIVYTEGIANDENGRPASIFTGSPQELAKSGNLELSGAGFVKWIIDGLILPITGKAEQIAALTTPTITYHTGSLVSVLSESYNLTFALDWIRNLAISAVSTRSKLGQSVSGGGTDVQKEPFVAGFKTFFTPNTGYRIEILFSLLYVLAAQEPDTFYLAAIRETDRHHEGGEVQYFNKCAAIFPYFDPWGRFNVAVFENGTEYPLDEFIQKYSDNFVYLTRIRSSSWLILQ